MSCAPCRLPCALLLITAVLCEGLAPGAQLRQRCSPPLRQYAEQACADPYVCELTNSVDPDTGAPVFRCANLTQTPSPVPQTTPVPLPALQAGSVCREGSLADGTFRDNSDRCVAGTRCIAVNHGATSHCTAFSGCVVNGIVVPVGEAVVNPCRRCTCSATGDLACTNSLCSGDREGSMCQVPWSTCGDGSICMQSTARMTCQSNSLIAQLGTAISTCLASRPGCAPLHTSNPTPRCATACPSASALPETSSDLQAETFCTNLEPPSPSQSHPNALRLYHMSEEYCCIETNTHCATYDCSWVDDTTPWLRRKREYCCSWYSEVCQAWEGDFTAAAGAWECIYNGTEVSRWGPVGCCEKYGLHCDPDVAACFSTGGAVSESDFRLQMEGWAPEMRQRCCNEHGIGCSVDCTASGNYFVSSSPISQFLNATERRGCCASVGLHCPAPQLGVDETAFATHLRTSDVSSGELQRYLFSSRRVDHGRWLRWLLPEGAAETPDALLSASSGMVHRAFTIRMSHDVDNLYENPKRFVRLLRRSLLAASAGLTEEPRRLAVHSVGALLHDLGIPSLPAHAAFRINSPLGWNAESLDGEISLNSSGSPFWGVLPNLNATQLADAHRYWKRGGAVFASFYIMDPSPQVVDSIAAAVNSSLSAGSMSKRRNGLALPVHPLFGLEESVPPPRVASESSGTSATTAALSIAAGVLFLVLPGGAAALCCRRRRTGSSVDEQQFSDNAHDAEVKETGSGHGVPTPRSTTAFVHPPVWGATHASDPDEDDTEMSVA